MVQGLLQMAELYMRSSAGPPLPCDSHQRDSGESWRGSFPYRCGERVGSSLYLHRLAGWSLDELSLMRASLSDIPPPPGSEKPLTRQFGELDTALRNHGLPILPDRLRRIRLK